MSDTVAGLLGDIGVGADTASEIAPIATDTLIGAGLGAVGGVIGGNPALGAAAGAGAGALTGAATDILSPAVTPAAPTGTSALSLGGGPGGSSAPIDVTSLDTSSTPVTPVSTMTSPESLTSQVLNTPATGSTGVGVPTISNANQPDINSLFTPSGGAAPPAGSTSGSNLWNDLTSGNTGNLPGDVGNLIAKNPGAVLAGGGLLYNLTRNNSIPGESNLNNEAAFLSSQGAQLSSYLQKGTLPPGVQTSIQTATKAAEASIRSKYAALGTSGGTAELQEINAVREAAVSQGAQIAESLLSTGIQESGLASGIYENLIRINQAQSQQTGAAIANFAAALNGTVPGITLKVA